MDRTVSELRDTYLSGRTRSYEYRMSQLTALSSMLKAIKEEYLAAMYTDMRKPHTETYLTEVFYTDHELGFAMKHLERWMRNTKVKPDVTYALDDIHLYPEPRGVALIFGAWNYPLQMVAAPLVGAIAAGCCAVIKPSENAPTASAVIAKYFEEFMDPECYRVVEGGYEAAEELLEQRWDHIFFTGSTQVGRTVAMKAAESLTPVTLELGGKSPAIVDETANVDSAAKRIVWGKFINTGQTCIAPDYIIIHKERKEELISGLKKYIEMMYTKDPQQCPDYGRIINHRHFHRISKYLKSGDVIYGGRTDEAEKYISPTLLDNMTWESDIMRDEIFGPILPLLEYEHLPYITDRLMRLEKPLVAYHFSTSKKHIAHVERHLPTGTLSINDTITFVGVPQLPFGGIGNSGQGRYHGKATFDTFTNYKSVHHRSAGLESFNYVRYPPYTDSKFKDFVFRMAFYNSGRKRGIRSLLRWK